MCAKSLLHIIVSVISFLFLFLTNSQCILVILSAKTLVLTVELIFPPIHLNPKLGINPKELSVIP